MSNNEDLTKKNPDDEDLFGSDEDPKIQQDLIKPGLLTKWYSRNLGVSIIGLRMITNRFPKFESFGQVADLLETVQLNTRGYAREQFGDVLKATLKDITKRDDDPK